MFSNKFAVYTFFFKKHKFKKHEVQKSEILRKHLRNIDRLTLTNITGKITFFNTVFLKKVTVSILKKNNKCNRIKFINAFNRKVFFTSKEIDKIILKE